MEPVIKSVRERLLNERRELAIKVRNLGAFITREAAELNLSFLERHLLRNQWNAMSLYLMCLDERIALVK